MPAQSFAAAWAGVHRITTASTAASRVATSRFRPSTSRRTVVPKVLAVALLLCNLGAFGFDEPGGEPSGATADLEVPGGTPLGLVARAAGTSVMRLRERNPELVAGRLPARHSAIPVHVPSSAVPRAVAMLPRLLAPPRPGEERFIVDDAFDWGTDELPPRGRPWAPTLPSPIGMHSDGGKAGLGGTRETGATSP